MWEPWLLGLPRFSDQCLLLRKLVIHFQLSSFLQESEFEEMDSTVELERGQNIFEIHIDRVIMHSLSRHPTIPVWILYFLFAWFGTYLLSCCHAYLLPFIPD